jgi:hypothetical protein
LILLLFDLGFESVKTIMRSWCDKVAEAQDQKMSEADKHNRGFITYGNPPKGRLHSPITAPPPSMTDILPAFEPRAFFIIS